MVLYPISFQSRWRFLSFFSLVLFSRSILLYCCFFSAHRGEFVVFVTIHRVFFFSVILNRAVGSFHYRDVCLWYVHFCQTLFGGISLSFFCTYHVCVFLHACKMRYARACIFLPLPHSLVGLRIMVFKLNGLKCAVLL